RLELSCLSERISILIDQNAGEKTLILQASSPAISDTLCDSSQAQRLENQSVYAEGVCRFSLHRSFLSLCYRRSEVEGGTVPTRDWLLNLQILTSGGFR